MLGSELHERRLNVELRPIGRHLNVHIRILAIIPARCRHTHARVSDRLRHVPCTCPEAVIGGTHPNADVDTRHEAMTGSRLAAVVDNSPKA